MSDLDVMDILADWQNFQRTETGATLRTSCIMPSGSVLRVSVQRAIDGWIVCDEGGAIYEAMGRGMDVSSSLRGLSSKMAHIGLKVDHGKIYSNRVSVGELPYMMAYVATAALDAANWLVGKAAASRASDIAERLPRLLSDRYSDFLLTEPLSIRGKSEKMYLFRNVLLLPSKNRLVLDPVTRNDSAIKSRLVANLDVAQARHLMLVQHIVYDDDENWEQQELALLSVGASAIPFSKVSGLVDRMAA